MLTAFFFLLFLTDGVCPQSNCSYQQVLNHLNLTKNNELFSMTRPAKNYKQPTRVSLEVLLYAILDVVEKEQTFNPYVLTVMRWRNEYISWDPNQFCGITNVSLPTDVLWKPDITIEEMTEKDKATPSPYATITHEGDVEVKKSLVVISTCRMRIHNFPFDTQRCNLSFKSLTQTVKDIRLQASDNSSEAMKSSRELMRTQYEWLFINMIVTTKNATDSEEMDVIVYTITMKRRPLLHIVNFLLPVFFFVCLDLSSFLISESGGEKLSFKVTVLLAVTVLQLILNEILPASSNRIPLIALYCIGNFALMMLSLLETIFVMHLMEKDASSQVNSNSNQTLTDDFNKQFNSSSQNCRRASPKCSQSTSAYELSTGETLSELQPVAGEGEGTDQRSALEKVTDELRGIRTILRLLIKIRSAEEEPGYWTCLAKKVNKAFFVLYLSLVVLFLTCIFTKWSDQS